MRRESPEEQDNLLNLHSRKGYWKLPVKFIAFSVKSVISRI